MDVRDLFLQSGSTCFTQITAGNTMIRTAGCDERSIGVTDDAYGQSTAGIVFVSESSSKTEVV